MAITDQSLQKYKEILERDSKRKWSDDEVREAAERLTQFASLLIDIFLEEKKKEKKLDEFPNGYHLEDRDGQYHCRICYRYIEGKDTWYDKYGLKCINCQRNIDNGVIPGEICKDEDSWFRGWQLKSDLGIHPQTAKKLVREGKLKVRELKDEEGKTYFRVYLVSENREFLKTVNWKAKSRKNPIMVDKEGPIF
ncbi:MAG: hypothetical protein ACOX0X_00545 [Candidatus Dojkabacteria bacterium]|jgi:hypothetical protein